MAKVERDHPKWDLSDQVGPFKSIYCQRKSTEKFKAAETLSCWSQRGKLYAGERPMWQEQWADSRR